MPMFARLRNALLVKPKSSVILRPEAMVSNLNCRFHLGLDVIPSFKQHVIKQVISASTKNSFFLAQLNNGIEVGALAEVNKILRVADLEIVRVNDDHRIRFIDKRSGLTTAVRWVLENCLATFPATTEGFQMPMDEGEKEKFSHIIFAEGRDGYHLSMPTKEEYADNDLMRAAVEKGKEDFLKEPDKGFDTANISFKKFLRTKFYFIGKNVIKKGFIGATLLKKRQGKTSRREIVSLLRNLGIEVKGEVKGGVKGPLILPAKDEREKGKLMRMAIMSRKESFLKEPGKGLRKDNIHLIRFLQASFVYQDKDGKEIRFKGIDLLRWRSKGWTEEGIAALLRELGIEA